MTRVKRTAANRHLPLIDHFRVTVPSVFLKIQSLHKACCSKNGYLRNSHGIWMKRDRYQQSLDISLTGEREWSADDTLHCKGYSTFIEIALHKKQRCLLYLKKITRIKHHYIHTYMYTYMYNVKLCTKFKY